MIKKTSLLLLIFGASLFAQENNPLDYDRLSETLGHLIVRNLANPGIDFNLDKIIQGMQDEREQKPSPMSEEEYEQMIYTIQENLFIEAAEKNLNEANDFLKQNADQESICAIDEKLQYKVMKEGEGTEVTSESIPLIHYKGSLIDGTVFADSHEDESQAISLPLKQSIPGFAKGLVGMKEGEKRTLYIHPELAYGISGQLPPNSLLIFEVEIVKANTAGLDNLVEKE